MSNQRKILHDDRNGLDYVLVGDYYLPVLSLPASAIITGRNQTDWVLGNASKRIYEKL